MICEKITHLLGVDNVWRILSQTTTEDTMQRSPDATYEFSGELREHTPWIRRMRHRIYTRNKEREAYRKNPCDPRDLDKEIPDSYYRM